jgi:hypothetical protein
MPGRIPGRRSTDRLFPETIVTYGTYQLGDGTWQAIAAFASVKAAKAAMVFHALGRAWRVSSDPESLPGGERYDWLQSAVIARAAALKLTAYAIAKLTDGKVSEDHVKDYLLRRKSMGSHKLQHVLRVLGMEVRTRI